MNKKPPISSMPSKTVPKLSSSWFDKMSTVPVTFVSTELAGTAGSASVTFCVLSMLRLPSMVKGASGGGGSGGGLEGGGLDGGGLDGGGLEGGGDEGGGLEGGGLDDDGGGDEVLDGGGLEGGGDDGGGLDGGGLGDGVGDGGGERGKIGPDSKGTGLPRSYGPGSGNGMRPRSALE